MGPAWAQDVHLGNQSELRYSYHVVCNQFYHGEACSAYCRPRNDPFGHFSCDADGRRVCQEGWSGEYCSDRESLLAMPPGGATGLVGSQWPLLLPSLLLLHLHLDSSSSPTSPPPPLLLSSSSSPTPPQLLHLSSYSSPTPPPLPHLLPHLPYSSSTPTSSSSPPLLCSFFPVLTSLRL